MSTVVREEGKMVKRRVLLLIAVAALILVMAGSPLFAQKANFKGVTVTIAVLAGGTSGAISGPLYYYRDAWQKETGGKVNIAEIPFSEMASKIKTDLITGAGRYDAFVACANLYGDYIAGNFIIPIDKFYNDKSGKFPKWNMDDETPAQAALYKWGGKMYGILLDSDGWLVYGNRDAFENPEAKKKFKEKYGYPLAMPATTQQYLDMCEFFTGWDWNGDGEDDYGNVMPLKVGGQAAFWFEAWAAPYITLPGPVVDATHNTAFFNPDTMEPAINSPGAVQALEDYIKLYQYAPQGSLGWDLSEAWDIFLKGKAALSVNPGDILTLAQDTEKSKIRGKLLSAPLPGRTEVWNRGTNSWQEFSKAQYVGNTIGCSWHGVISRLSKHPDAAYSFLSYLAVPQRLVWLTAHGWTGINFGKIYDFPPEISGGNGTGSLKGYLDAGWDKADALSGLRAVWRIYYESDAYEEYLRIPGSVQLLDSVDKHVGAALAGQESAQDSLDAVAGEWNRIIDTLGRDTEKIYYQQSIGFGQKPPKYFPKK